MKWFQTPWFIFGLIVLVFLIFGASVELNWWIFKDKDLSQSGTFGDSFGVFTSLFSALAFGGLLITIWQQQKDLSLTREEMKNQQFENMLFKMLEVHASIVADMDFRSRKSNNQQTVTGRDCFTVFLKRLNVHYRFYEKKNSVRPEVEIIEQAYNYFWPRNRNNLGHYFRYVYNIFKFIDASGRDDKKDYANIVRAQLSDYELVVLFYNCLSVYGRERFRPLAVKYSLFDNMPIDLLIRPSHESLYPAEAYGKIR